jgi:hypothetical protein
MSKSLSLRAFHHVSPQKIQKILSEKIEISPSFTHQNIEKKKNTVSKMFCAWDIMQKLVIFPEGK